MKKKNMFLETIKEELEKLNYKEVDSVIEYYEEIIDERKEAGEKEETIIKSLGSIETIVKSFEVDRKIEKATEKPTVSNGIKAVIATLSLLSLPLLLPMVIVIAALAFTAAILLASLGIVSLSVMFAASVGVIAVFYNMASGIIPVSSGIFALGIVLVLGSLSLELGRFLMKVSKSFIISIVNACRNQVTKIKGGRV